MDRFSWYQAGEAINEDILLQAPAVCLYDGEDKTAFEVGTASMTTNRLIWADSADPNCRLCLHFSLVLGIEKHHRRLTRSGKIMVHLAPCPAHLQGQGPVATSKYSYVRLSFRHGGEEEFHRKFKDALEKKQWQRCSSTLPGRNTRTGLVGIERSMAEQNSKTTQDIHLAFEDLSKLMQWAGEMVATSKAISEKLRLKRGDISEDETVQFKSYLLSLGVSDPVTKRSHGTGAVYHQQLAKELSSILSGPLLEVGGSMTLPDVFCRVNRARGLELLSPEDLLNACQALEFLDLPIKMHQFESGVVILQLKDQGLETKIDETSKLVDKHEFLTPEKFAKIIHIPVILAKERLVTAEESGNLCRDETVEGLRFFPNKFMTMDLDGLNCKDNSDIN